MGEGESVKTVHNSSAALKKSAIDTRSKDLPEKTARQPLSKDDQEIVLNRMSLALCRQYIMWPTSGALPCEQGIACDKSSQCRKMAQDVMDYTNGLSEK